MKNILGVDIGGQGIKLRYEDEQGKVVTQIERGEKYTIERLQAIISQFISSKGIQVDTLGISQTGIIVKNELQKSATQPYLEGMNRESFKIIGINNAFILNDGRAMAFAASKRYGLGNIVAIAAGTGIGSGIIVNGDIVNGANNKAGEIHCIPIETEDGVQYLGALCSGKAIVKRFGLEYMKQHMEDEEVQEEIKKAGRYMGLYIIMTKYFLDPEVIFITGGATSFEGYFEAAMSYVRKNMPTIDLEKTIIAKSAEPFFDGCIGAEWYAYLKQQSIL